jgi:hypothetical protein
MAVRSRYVEPDQVRETADGPLPYVTDEAYFNALLAVAQVQAVAGGIVTAVVQRAPTGIPNEMVTTSALVEGGPERPRRAALRREEARGARSCTSR